MRLTKDALNRELFVLRETLEEIRNQCDEALGLNRASAELSTYESSKLRVEETAR